MRSSSVLFAALALASGLAVGCSKQVGDPCRTSIDCSINGDRSCDISQPGGYCTVEGCDDASCPEDSTCVRLFPTPFLTQACDPRHEDLDEDACRPEDVCVPTPVTPGATPTGTEPKGVCAPRATERRFCAKTCGDNGDCRGDYVCRGYGELGAYAFTDSMSTRRFCAPNPK